jgi:hypothetical protein
VIFVANLSEEPHDLVDVLEFVVDSHKIPTTDVGSSVRASTVAR